MKKKKKVWTCLLLILAFFIAGSKGLDLWAAAKDEELEAEAETAGWVNVKNIIPEDPTVRAETADKDQQLFFLLAGVDWD